MVVLVLSVMSSEMEGIIELSFIQLRPDKKRTDRRETNYMLMILFIDS